MPEMRKCKECGKLFMPKGRERYCSAVHYRPCPICGQPAEVLYFSDPPRRCDNCRGKKNVQPLTTLQKAILASPTSEPKMPASTPTTDTVEEDASELFTVKRYEPTKEVQAIIDKSYPAVDMDKDEMLNEEHVWTYVGIPVKNGFIPGHTYKVRVSDEDRSAYILRSNEDITTGESVNIYDRVSSTIMLNRYFVKDQPTNKAV